MAYYGSNYCNTDYDDSEYLHPDRPFFADSSYGFLEYNPSRYYESYQYPTVSSMAYSVFTPTAPKFIEYNLPASTQFTVSYNEVEFNLPDFEEYDPTPYGGGYDIALTYGKSLPASDEICYPTSNSTNPIAVLPVEKEQIGLPESNKEQQIVSISKEEPVSDHDDGDHDYSPWTGEEGEYKYKEHVPQMPSGYGLETLDICESLFGNWPCLSRMKKRCNCEQQRVWEDCNGGLGSGAADYLFGSPNPYEMRVGGECYGDPVYSYERHYKEQPRNVQVECYKDPWNGYLNSEIDPSS